MYIHKKEMPKRQKGSCNNTKQALKMKIVETKQRVVIKKMAQALSRTSASCDKTTTTKTNK